MRVMEVVVKGGVIEVDQRRHDTVQSDKQILGLDREAAKEQDGEQPLGEQD